jgi:hypothetical protein
VPVILANCFARFQFGRCFVVTHLWTEVTVTPAEAAISVSVFVSMVTVLPKRVTYVKQKIEKG